LLCTPQAPLDTPLQPGSTFGGLLDLRPAGTQAPPLVQCHHIVVMLETEEVGREAACAHGCCEGVSMERGGGGRGRGPEAHGPCFLPAFLPKCRQPARLCRGIAGTVFVPACIVLHIASHTAGPTCASKGREGGQLIGDETNLTSFPLHISWPRASTRAQVVDAKCHPCLASQGGQGAAIRRL